MDSDSISKRGADDLGDRPAGALAQYLALYAVGCRLFPDVDSGWTVRDNRGVIATGRTPSAAVAAAYLSWTAQ